MNFKIGIGYDVHALQEGLDFWLGGVKIEHNKGCLAYSDGDVLIHAICDAILGAANLRDIGYNFPDTDNKYNTEYHPGSIPSECKYCCPASQYFHYICHRQKCCPQYRPPFFSGYRYCEEGSPATACSQILW